jgi:hypothetical protein
MTVSSGNLDSLVGVVFSSVGDVEANWQSVTTTGTGTQASFLTVVATSDGGLSGGGGLGILNLIPPETAMVTSVNDIANTISLTVSEPLGGKVFTETVYVLGYSQNALLVSHDAPYVDPPALGSPGTYDSSSHPFYFGNLGAISTSPLPSGTTFTFSSTGTFTASLACFAQGTRIASETGSVAVEKLREGELVRSALSGALLPIRWLGRREVDVARHPQPRTVAPICVLADAFGPGVPVRDLLLSPDHAVLIDKSLVPVRHLVNGTTINQIFPTTVTYFHVELDDHDILLAEGVPAESYLETGGRKDFENGGSSIMSRQVFTAQIWESLACAPLVLTGLKLRAIQNRLAVRAGALATAARSSLTNTPRKVDPIFLPLSA